MNKFSRFALISLSAITVALFLYSAYTKLFPTIQAFEYNIAGRLHVHYLTAAIMARFFIALEAALGSMILLHLFGKGKWVLKSAFALIALFSVYLVWLWVKMGNEINCGCFGDAIWMSPSVSLIKNVITLIILALIIRYHKGYSFPWADAIPIVHITCLLLVAFTYFPVFTYYKLSFKALYANAEYAPTTDLTKGRFIIAFVSRSCSHCRAAALKMHHIKERNPTIPFYMIIGGTDTALADFWQETQAKDIPWSRLPEEPFMEYTGGEFPQIIWVNNSRVEANTTYPELDQKVIEEWMKQP